MIRLKYIGLWLALIAKLIGYDHRKMILGLLSRLSSMADLGIACICMLKYNAHRAYSHAKKTNYNIEGPIGTRLHSKTVGVLGSGRIGVDFMGITKQLDYKLSPKDSDSRVLGK